MIDSLFPDYQPVPQERSRRCRVHFLPSGLTVEVEVGTLLIDAAHTANLYVPQQCGGMAICSWCRMKVIEGEEHLSPLTPGEERLQRWESLSPAERASCQAEVYGHVTVEI